MHHPFSPQAMSSYSTHQPPTIPGRLRLPVTSSLPNLRREHKPDSDGRAMGSQPGSPSLANAPSPASLQNHIYTAFLERRTADVALHIRGSWHAIYKLHRVVLIQAGFFRSLFTSGFAESKIKLTSHRLGPDIVDVVLEDSNITRAAFEVCIAHLYGGGPELFVSPSLIPTTKQPLTSVFPLEVGSECSPVSDCPPGKHPASPRFLLSLLATAVFLSITPIATQAMSSVLNTIGPYTVVRYLNFALGRGIGEPDLGEPEGAVGLESVAEMLEDERDSILEVDESTTQTPRALNVTNPLEKLKDSTLEAGSSQLSIEKEDPSEGDSSQFSSRSISQFEPEYFFYGVVSDKIGEAAACWLARWGIDMLRYELQLAGRDVADVTTSSQSAGNRRRASTVPGGSGSSMPFVRTDSMKKQNIPVIWRRGGLTARWIRGLLSSDMFFILGEKERYDAARRAVELRRAEGILEEEEQEYAYLFAKGIYYTNMGLDELMSISKDASPTTGKPYVPLAVLQSAHWDQSVLRHTITSRSGSASSPPSSPEPSPHGKELGVTVAHIELVSALDKPSIKSLHATIQPDAPYYPVPSDSSQRIGDNTGIEGASLDHIFEGGSSPAKASDGATIPCSEANFFGTAQNARTASQCVENKSDKINWSPYPPFRFSVEFWDVEALKEKSRLHSRTVWYAGSLWNVYVQIVRKKGIQLGVYLHRQSCVDPIPPSSAPASLSCGSNFSTPANTIRREASHFTGAPLQQTLSSLSVQYPTPSTSRSATPHTAPSTPAMSSSLPSSYSSGLPSSTSATSTTTPATAPPISPTQPYRDPRAAVSAYFTIACAGSTGSSLTRFSSAPDVFSVSQSWGWKSSSLRTAENLELDGDGVPRDTAAADKEVSLRATVVLGVV
ncbi:uncharacterized protein PHACADRAFT_246766 [Phanerochaete carnosa HHB-10118-sp]|uniref:BTB domain-containing protein n=1 Tax=Phanerochaete carnosa (strain HHB-10118-sp) TaxID=650164 RepID=K5WMM8_PHACS|nr:uncharacterized protein PHACADRAFT_246766 [Phanerochaete carnosa HHB-10118-sp]EKM60700.1 hypothetical protein PHACADRAFT_246766 [Phanerochaete carnosa HHB-10118-sp]